MTLAHTERIQTDMTEHNPEAMPSGDALDKLLASFPDDLGTEAAPTEEDAKKMRAESDAIVARLTDGLYANIVLDDVLDVDEPRQFTFANLTRRLPFDGFNFSMGANILSDNILTTRERKLRKQAAEEAAARGESYEEELGIKYARHTLGEQLDELGFSDHAQYVAKLALSELCSNTSIHGEGIDGIAGRCEAQYFPEMGRLVITAINVSNRPKQRKEDDPRGVQEKGRGLSLLAGFLREPNGQIGDNLGRFRYSDSIVERYSTSPAAEVAGIGRTATFAVIAKDLADNSRNNPEFMESPHPKLPQNFELPTDEA